MFTIQKKVMELFKSIAYNSKKLTAVPKRDHSKVSGIGTSIITTLRSRNITSKDLEKLQGTKVTNRRDSDVFRNFSIGRKISLGFT
ncbi:MAG: hypothetical protein R2813_10285 [Flavobacteriales bacterium]